MLTVKGTQARTIAGLSFPLAGLIIAAASTGLFTNDFYLRETQNWKAQAICQDAIDLFVVMPALVVTAIMSVLKNKKAFLLWGGVNLYLVYTYVIYCFDVHFNSLFIVYCLSLGLSFYSCLYFLFSQKQQANKGDGFGQLVVKIIAGYFLVIAVIFYVLWLSEIMPCIFSHTVPESLKDSGMITNPVHVLDLSVLLPGIFIVGVLLLKQAPSGLILVPVVLAFFILMDITIGALAFFMEAEEIRTGYMLTGIMGALAFFSVGLLAWFFKKVDYP